jgi:hypothetical protein
LFGRNDETPDRNNIERVLVDQQCRHPKAARRCRRRGRLDKLDPMTARQFVHFLKPNLPIRISKVTPDNDISTIQAPRILEEQVAKEVLARARDEVLRKTARFTLPKNLWQRIEDQIEADPVLRWDPAMDAIIARVVP